VAPLRGAGAVLRDRWLARGYLQAAVGARGDTLLLSPGGPWELGAWDVGGEDFPGRERLLGDWLPPTGSRFEAQRLDAAAAGLLEAVGELGYPFPRWVVSDLRLDTSRRAVDVAAVLLPGKAASIGPVTTDLADDRARRFLARASGLRPGAPVRGSDLHRAVERLWARDLWEEIGEPRVYATTAADTVGVHLPARARPKPNRLQVVLGLSRRGEAERARLSGEVDLRLPNLAGSGRALRVGWRDDGAGRSRFGFGWLEPLAFGTPLDASLSLDSEVLDAQYTRFTTELGVRLPVVALWGLEVAAGWDRATYPEGALARTARSRARAALTHRRGDRARSGWEGAFAVESAWRSAQAREGSVGTAELAAASRQRLLSGDVSGEAWLGRRAALAARLSVRRLAGDEREATLAEHFRFGGAATLRGYGEGEFHGVEAAWASLEWRLGPPRGSRLYTFWDVGYFGFWSAAAAPAEGLERRRGWPRGYGVGLLARTPGGDLSLAVGFPGTVDFDLAKLHVTLLESF
jgi:outer membrane protein assembly factor BamA